MKVECLAQGASLHLATEPSNQCFKIEELDLPDVEIKAEVVVEEEGECEVSDHFGVSWELSEMESSSPPELSDFEETTVGNVIPEKSRHLYLKCYDKYQEWAAEHQLKITTENALLAYFTFEAQKVKPPTLWSKYSMLRTTIKIKDNVDIKGYKKVQHFLKKKNVAYRPKKSKVCLKSKC